MAVGVKLNAVFQVSTTTYTASMDLPTATPSAAAPFKFAVTSEPTSNINPAGASIDPTLRSNLVAVAVGGTGHVFVSVGPPTSLLTDAGADMVKQLNIQVQDGTYNKDTGTFAP